MTSHNPGNQGNASYTSDEDSDQMKCLDATEEAMDVDQHQQEDPKITKTLPENVKNDILNLKVLIVGLGGLGAEVARGLIQGGVQNLTFLDESKVEKCDLSSQCYLTEKDVNKFRATVIHNYLSNLYPLTTLSVSKTGADSEDAKQESFSQHDIVVLTHFDPKDLQLCHENQKSVVLAETNGQFGRIFWDFYIPALGKTCMESVPAGDSDGAGTGNKSYEESKGNPSFAECPFSQSHLAPTIRAAYLALRHFQETNPSETQLESKTLAKLAQEFKTPDTFILLDLLKEFLANVKSNVSVPVVNACIGSLAAQQILQFLRGVLVQPQSFQWMYLYGGLRRFSPASSKINLQADDELDNKVVDVAPNSGDKVEEHIDGHPSDTGLLGPKSAEEQLPLKLPPPINSDSVGELYVHGGIELRKNSCYIDTALFSMFSCTKTFDNMVLTVPQGDESCEPLTLTKSTEIKHILQIIVTRLRNKKFVPWANIWKLRETLVSQGFTKKLLGSFMDPEELFYILFDKALNLPRFFNYNTGHGDFAHQIFLPKSQGRPVATVQDLFEASMKYSGDLKLEGVPDPALIILMPRSNGALVGYKQIVPNLELDLTNVLTEAKMCSCGKNVATIACDLCPSDALTYCEGCISQGNFVHDQAPSVSESEPKSPQFHEFSQRKIPYNQNLKMKLVAVVCLSMYHYTAFVRCGEEWMYFDSIGPVAYPVENCGSFIMEASQKLTQNGADWDSRDNLTMKRIFRDCQYCIYEP